jgi:hypothetical protein
MKMANVVSVRDVEQETHPELNRSGRRKEIEALLRRYPNVRDSETQEIVRFLATGPHLDVGLVTGNDELAEKVNAVRRANASHFKLKVHEVLLFLLAAGGPAVFLLGKYLL